MRQVLILLSVLGLCLANPVFEPLEEGPACPIADPLDVPAGGINVTLPPFLVIDEGSVHSGGIATGLSTLYYKYTINLLTLKIDFEVTIDTACISGDQYSATGVIDAAPFRQETIPSGPLTGSGSYQACVADFHIIGDATLLVNLITNRLTIRILNIPTFIFSSLSANIAGLNVGGELINWTQWNANIKQNFDQDLANHRTAIVEKVRLSINEEMRKYTLAEFLDLIGGGGGEPEPCDRH
jgi:hypothetical protein